MQDFAALAVEMQLAFPVNPMGLAVQVFSADPTQDMACTVCRIRATTCTPAALDE